MNESRIKTSFTTAIIYSMGIFALGFILGTIRTILLIPRIGALAGVLIEIPIMLTVSWFFCRRLINKYSIAKEIKYLLLFGGSAFFLLMIVEIFFSVFVFNKTLNEFLESNQTLPGFLGLLAQIGFGLIPSFQSKLD